MNRHWLMSGLLVVLTQGLLWSSSASSQTDQFAGVVVTPTEVAPNVFMMTGAGGNIGVSAGPDGILIIDDQFAPLAGRIASALEALADASFDPAVRYVINTHYHVDHTGSNAFFAERGATIIAHDKVRVRLLGNDSATRASLPVVTHSNGLSIYLNDEELTLIALAGHTDGDSAVWFKKANILHTGDLLFNGLFPYIDLEGGGSVDDYLASQAELLEWVDEDTQLIPGHGPLATVDDLRAMHTMIRLSAQSVRDAVAAGEPLEAIIARGVDAVYKPLAWSFISESRWLEILYTDAIQNSRPITR